MINRSTINIDRYIEKISTYANDNKSKVKILVLSINQLKEEIDKVNDEINNVCGKAAHLNIPLKQNEYLHCSILKQYYEILCEDRNKLERELDNILSK